MRLARLLADPWTFGAGTFLGALAGVGVGIGAPAAVGIGVVGYAVGTAVKALTSRDDTGSEPPPGLVLPPRGSSARVLYDRAKAAVADLGEIAGTPTSAPLRAQAGSVHEQAREALDGIARIAAQTVVLRQALERVDVAQAQRDAQALERAQAHEGGGHEESLAAVRSQLEVAARLDRAARAADNRLLSSVLGLEALVASMAEVVAMGAGSGDDGAGTRIRGLSEDLTGLRVGLAEAEETSRRALSG